MASHGQRKKMGWYSLLQVVCEQEQRNFSEIYEVFKKYVVSIEIFEDLPISQKMAYLRAVLGEDNEGLIATILAAVPEVTACTRREGCIGITNQEFVLP